MTPTGLHTFVPLLQGVLRHVGLIYWRPLLIPQALAWLDLAAPLAWLSCLTGGSACVTLSVASVPWRLMLGKLTFGLHLINLLNVR